MKWLKCLSIIDWIIKNKEIPPLGGGISLFFLSYIEDTLIWCFIFYQNCYRHKTDHHTAWITKQRKKSCTKIVSAMMTIIYFFRVRKKLFTLPYMPLSACPLHNRHPPVVAQKDTKSDHPLQNNPANIINAKEDQPQTSVFAALIWQLHLLTAASGTLSIDPHM